MAAGWTNLRDVSPKGNIAPVRTEYSPKKWAVGVVWRIVRARGWRFFTDVTAAAQRKHCTQQHGGNTQSVTQ